MERMIFDKEGYMKEYSTPNIEILMLEEVDVIRTSEGTSNDNNYSDTDWGF